MQSAIQHNFSCLQMLSNCCAKEPAVNDVQQSITILLYRLATRDTVGNKLMSTTCYRRVDGGGVERRHLEDISGCDTEGLSGRARGQIPQQKIQP